MTDGQWAQFEQEGYLRLGRLLADSEREGLQRQIEQIMLGKAAVNYEAMLMQLDSENGKYEDAGPQTKGFKGPTLNYRKIQDLEHVPSFLMYLERPVFRDICARTYGHRTTIAIFRAMFMNKPARRGSWLPWHQDRWTQLDRDPLITVWTALDPATIANGCVQVIPGSHAAGLINPSNPSGFLTDDQARLHAPKERIEFLDLKAGEAVLLHNHLLHASDVNKTDIPRRAFSVCYMDAGTLARDGQRFTPAFGHEGAEASLRAGQ